MFLLTSVFKGFEDIQGCKSKAIVGLIAVKVSYLNNG